MKAGQASATAKVIAASTLLLAAEGKQPSLVADGAATLCRRFLSTCHSDRWLAASAQSAISRWAWRLLERCTHPGIIAHYGMRKRWIEQRVLDGLIAHRTRIIVLGAGFDTLAIRLAARYPELEVFEVDHPDTQSLKRRALIGYPHRLPVFAEIDLALQPLPDTLFVEGKRHILIAEGVLMYLPGATIDAHLGKIASVPAATELIFSCMSRWPDGSSGFRPRSRLIDFWLRKRGEPFTWAIAPQHIEDFLTTRGWALNELAVTRSFAAASSRLDGENLVRCRPAG